MKRPIGFIDSGLGGISVLKEVQKLLPMEDYYYYGDSFHHPYGERSKDNLLKVVDEGIQELLKQNCKLIVVACNTATTMVLPEIRKKYPEIPFVGTEPALKVAYDYYPNKRVLVMGTKGTIESERLQFLNAQYPIDNVTFLACPELAPLIEEGDQTKIKTYLEETLSSYQGKVDVIVLGCTHYVFVKPMIKEILKDVILLDGNQGIANQVKHLLEEKGL